MLVQLINTVWLIKGAEYALHFCDLFTVYVNELELLLHYRLRLLAVLSQELDDRPSTFPNFLLIKGVSLIDEKQLKLVGAVSQMLVGVTL